MDPLKKKIDVESKWMHAKKKKKMRIMSWKKCKGM